MKPPRSVRPKTSRARAFTLMEVIMALGIFAFAAPSLIGMIAASRGASRHSAFQSRAPLLARQVFEDLRQPLSDASSQRLLTGGSGRMPVQGADFGPCVYYFDAQLQWLPGDRSPETLGPEYATGAQDERAAYLVTASGTRLQAEALSQVLLTVETPACAPAATRVRERFLSLVKLNP